MLLQRSWHQANSECVLPAKAYLGDQEGVVAPHAAADVLQNCRVPGVAQDLNLSRKCRLQAGVLLALEHLHSNLVHAITQAQVNLHGTS